jgi:hypothetical protein
METGERALWSAHAADLIQWFQLRRSEMGDTPFALNAWTFVSIPARFYAALERDIAGGPRSVRAAALIEDLADLFALRGRE